MNEQIKELANKSYDVISYEYAGPQKFFNKQKFAQLITEECIEIARKRLIPSPLWENDENLKSHNQALWCVIHDIERFLIESD